jgi:glycosyltransferase involved in cell wall biosynthesis
MKVIITNSSHIWGGNENWAITAGRLLRDRGHQVSMLLLAGSPVVDRAQDMGLPVIAVPRFGGDLELPSLLRFHRIFRNERPDAVILTKTKEYWVCGVTSWSAGVPRRVLRLSIVRRVKDNLKYRLIYRTFVSHIIVNSREVREAIGTSAKWTADLDVHLLYNGMADPRSVGNPEELKTTARRLRRRWSIPEKSFVFGTCASLTRRKRLDWLISALAGLRDRLPTAHVVIAGDGEAREELLDLARQLQVAERVHLFGQQRDTNPLYHLFDLSVIASRQEGMPQAGIEALAHGCPMIATDCGGISELLDGGRCGLIVPVDDPRAFQAGLLRLARDGRLRDRYARMGRQYFEACFTEDRMASDLESILEGRPQPSSP